MKRIALVSLFILVSLFASAQELDKSFISESKAVKFEETKGELLKKELYRTTTILGLSCELRISPAMVTDLRSGAKEAYIIISSKTKDDLFVSVIDYEEIPACIEAFDYIINSEINSKPRNYTQVFIRTRDYLEIGAVYDVDALRWQTAISYRKYIEPPTFTLTVKRVQDIKEVFESAKIVLEKNLK